MSALAEQHERWTAARNRLWVRAQKKSPPQLKVEPAIAPEPVAVEPLPPDPSYLALIISATGKAHFAFQETQFGWPLPATHWKTIVREVAQSHGVRVVDMLSARRSPELVAARNEAFYRCREETSLSLPQIGKRFNRDHSTIIHGIRKFQERTMGVLHDDAE